MYFVDTSALVKAYIRERGTGAVHHAMRELGGSSLYISRLVVAEAMSVFTRKLREKSIRYAA
ncbi:MAG TPA: type II toxin-antitoxin system VapC family toxin [Longimicrobium sp.]|nr:type II toxin-antitoxin system VapC family toxin [Longimicrobium sp.]